VVLWRRKKEGSEFSRKPAKETGGRGERMLERAVSLQTLGLGSRGGLSDKGARCGTRGVDGASGGVFRKCRGEDLHRGSWWISASALGRCQVC